MRLPYLKAQSVTGKMLAIGLSFFMMSRLTASPDRPAMGRLVTGRPAMDRLAIDKLVPCRLATDKFVTGGLAKDRQQPGGPDLPTDSIPRQVGDIPFDPSIDDPAFRIPDSVWVFQYYNSTSYYLHHKKEIVRYFMTHYQPGADTVGQTGYCTVRFIINQAGQTGRFRCYQLDTAYQPILFRREMVGQLIGLIRQWKEWQPLKYKDKTYDTYQYITFTLKNGRIVCITP